MRKTIVVFLAALGLLAFSASSAFAAYSYNVTAGYGKKIEEQTPCGAIGSITIKPGPDSDGWTIDQVITVRFLAGPALCKAINQQFSWGGFPEDEGEGDYHVVGVVGSPFFTIKILTGGTVEEVVVPEEYLNSSEETVNSICVSLVGTPYSPNDPNYQLVQVSYTDIIPGGFNGSYSGDQYVATVVEPEAASEHPTGTGTKDQWESCGVKPGCLNTKTGDIEIPLCGSVEGQEQGCFCTESPCQALFTAANFEKGTYEFDFTISKPDVGLMGPAVYEWSDSNCRPIRPVETTYFDFEGDKISPADCKDWVEVKKVRVKFDSTYAIAEFKFFFNFAFDCDAMPGELYLNASACIQGQCKGADCSWVTLDGRTIAEFVPCNGPGPCMVSRTFPYIPNVDESWWAGLAIANPNDSEIKVNFDIYEMDGDKYTFSMAVPANGLKVGLFSDPLFFNPVPVGVEDGFGNEKFWMNAWSEDYFYGFLMLGDGVQAQGYLPEWTRD